MASTPELLKLSPLAALETLIQASLKSGFNVRYLKIGPPVAQSGLTTAVTLSLDKQKTPVDYWVFDGEATFVYNRLDLATFFADLNTAFTVDFPLSVTELLLRLNKRFGIVFDTDDFDAQTIAYTDHVTLQAGSLSKRWVGAFTVSLKQRIKSLLEVIQVKDLDAMLYPVRGVDSTDTPQVRLLESINRLNKTSLARDIKPGEISFGKPVALTQDIDAVNTELTIAVTSSDLWNGSVTVQYIRRYLPKMSNYNPIVIKDAKVTTQRQLAVLAAAKQQFYLDPNDVIDGPLPTLAAGEVRTLTLSVVDTSMMYFGDLTVDFSQS